MACDLIVNIFLCGWVHIFRGIFGIFVPLEGIVLTIASAIISSIIIYILAKTLGRIGGMLLAGVGLVGALFTAGISLTLTIIGVLITLFERSVMLIVIINIGLHATCMLLGCV